MIRPDLIGLFNQQMTPSLWLALALNFTGLALGLVALAMGVLA